MKRIIYHILAVFFIILGIIGIFLPVMPTVPFLLAALYFAADSPALQNFMHNNVLLKNYLKYSQGKQSLSKRKLVFFLICLWASLTVSAVVIREYYCYCILTAVGILVSCHLIHLAKK